jgi:3D (Asp-Asp-Asp) domain-containing protein
VSGPRTRSAARLGGIAVLLALAAGSTAAAAGPGSGYRKKAAQLEVQAQLLDSRAHKALLDVYALDSRLAAAASRLAALEARSSRLRARQETLTRQLAAARATLAVSQRQLGEHLRSLYEQGTVDPLAVMLGAQSLEDAITKLDDLTRLADQNRHVVAVTTAARTRLGRVRQSLVAQRRKVALALGEARSAERQLAAAHAERVSFVGGLRSQQRLKETQIRGLLATARAVEQKSQQIQAAADPAPPAAATSDQPPPAPAAADQGGRTLRVSATGYSLPGHTAIGLPVGWGIVAVDPSVIPLGTKLTVPGYGEAVAADVGSAVRGLDIDLWFPTLAEARAWGRRWVVITLH